MKLSYPTISLGISIYYSKKIALKHLRLPGARFSKEDALKYMELSPNSGYANNVFSALNQYGIISKDETGNYISRLGEKLLDNEKDNDALASSAFLPELFNELQKKYSRLQLNENHKDMLVVNYGVAVSQIETVIKIYNENLRMVFPEISSASYEPTIVQQDSKYLLVTFPSGVKISVPKKVIFDIVLKDLNSFK